MKKYRPVLTASQIAYLLSRCKQLDQLSNPIALACIGTLSVFQTKIQNEAVNAAYAVSPTISKLDSLGFSDTHPEEKSKKPTDETIATWLEIDSCNLSLQQLEWLQDYRYRNDLMSQEEEADFEATNF